MVDGGVDDDRLEEQMDVYENLRYAGLKL